MTAINESKQMYSSDNPKLNMKWCSRNNLITLLVSLQIFFLLLSLTTTNDADSCKIFFHNIYMRSDIFNREPFRADYMFFIINSCQNN